MILDHITLLVLATILLFFGHVARAARWALLFSPRIRTPRFNLLLGLSIGYAVNAIFPWRLGEILRAFFVSGRESIDFSFVAATVVAERLTDLFVVGMIVLAFTLFLDTASSKMVPSGIFMILTALSGIMFAILVRRSWLFRRLLWWVFSIFNDTVRIGIIEFFWSFSEIIAGSRVLGCSYLKATVFMWCIYFSSYLGFGLAIGETPNDTLYALLGSPSLPLMSRIVNGGGGLVCSSFVHVLDPADSCRHHLWFLVPMVCDHSGHLKALALWQFDERARPASRVLQVQA